MTDFFGSWFVDTIFSTDFLLLVSGFCVFFLFLAAELWQVTTAVMIMTDSLVHQYPQLAGELIELHQLFIELA